MINEKNFLNYEEQINYLLKKGIIIENKDFAIKILKDFSYFSLICGYKGPFKNKKKYKKNVKFENILNLYNFDEKLRNLFFIYILKIEKKLKSYYSYFFCERFGKNQSEYLNVNNYDYVKHQEKINKLVSILNSHINSNNYTYITHNRNNHKNVPLWILINCLTFGNVSKMYTYSITKDIKIPISKEFNIEHENLLSMLKVISKFRNVCAHNERLYDYKTRDSIRDLPIHSNFKFKKNGKNDLFAIVICFKYLLDEDSFNEFMSKIIKLLKDYKESSYNYNQILKNMGFPNNWEEICYSNI